MVGVGTLYHRGYFHQGIEKDGAQQALYTENEPGQLPITPVRHPNGEWLRLEIALPGYSVWLRAWKVQVGSVKRYLLDSTDAANSPAHRGITDKTYGGGPDEDLNKARVLGTGGLVLHLDPGHHPGIGQLRECHRPDTVATAPVVKVGSAYRKSIQRVTITSRSKTANAMSMPPSHVFFCIAIRRSKRTSRPGPIMAQ